ncbi:MAG TPA: DNA replication/repair protein RecF [Acidimicrobiales bacterium]|nr:DNA replication/repair protein RecF [Acidimicrobiales bacterium]
MQVLWLELRDFRNYATAELELASDGLTVVHGDNGEGKTNLIEAIGWLATLASFRGAPNEALVRSGATAAVIRSEADRDGRRITLEAELPSTGAPTVLVNRQRLRRSRDLLGALRVSVFSPDDLALVKGGPSERRRLLDEALVALHPRHAETQSAVERVLRQRATLLRQAGGRLTPEIASTLDVWDAKLAEHGTALAGARRELVSSLEPAVAKAYDQVAAASDRVVLRYVSSWGDDLAAALAAARADDIRRGVTTVGPHRDDLALSIAELPARTHASQGEQRSLALSLRLGVHTAVTEATESPPVLLLDDVFSELDPERSAALTAHLPAGQAILTTAGPLPPGAAPAKTVRIIEGRIV